MVTDCQYLPRETCSPERVQPKEITRPVIKKVIYIIYIIIYQCQYGCGNSKIVAPKRQDFWPKINKLKPLYFVNTMNDLNSDVKKFSFLVS